MRGNLLDKTCCEAVIRRAQKLRPESRPRWGQMTATEMLRHCNLVHAQLLAPAEPTQKKTSLQQYLLRWVVLYGLPRYPRGAQTPKHFRTQGKVDATQFEQEKQAFIDSVHRFAAHEGPITHRHPYFGQLTTVQWGRASWKHVDHHLRQFGL